MAGNAQCGNVLVDLNFASMGRAPAFHSVSYPHETGESTMFALFNSSITVETLRNLGCIIFGLPRRHNHSTSRTPH